MEDERKEYVDLAIKVIETRIDGMDRATIVKTSEIDRRLEEHNRLRQEVMTDRAQFLRSDTFDTFEKARGEWKTLVDNQLTKLMTKYENRMTTANITAVVALLLTVVNIIIFLVLHV